MRLSLSDAVERLSRNETSFKYLHLDGMLIGEAGAAWLAKALKSNTTLERLVLFRNNIGDAGAAKLAEAIKVNTTLRWLELDKNTIGDAGAERLAEALKANTTLRRLVLFNNYIGDAGAAKLAEAIEVNATLKRLHLMNNNIGDEGAERLAEAIEVNASLVMLDLLDNNIGDAGAAKLAEALEANTTLQTLELRGNTIGKSLIGKINQLVKRQRAPNVKEETRTEQPNSVTSGNEIDRNASAKSAAALNANIVAAAPLTAYTGTTSKDKGKDNSRERGKVSKDQQVYTRLPERNEGGFVKEEIENIVCDSGCGDQPSRRLLPPLRPTSNEGAVLGGGRRGAGASLDLDFGKPEPSATPQRLSATPQRLPTMTVGGEDGSNDNSRSEENNAHEGKRRASAITGGAKQRHRPRKAARGEGMSCQQTRRKPKVEEMSSSAEISAVELPSTESNSSTCAGGNRSASGDAETGRHSCYVRRGCDTVCSPGRSQNEEQLKRRCNELNKKILRQKFESEWETGRLKARIHQLENIALKEENADLKTTNRKQKSELQELERDAFETALRKEIESLEVDRLEKEVSALKEANERLKNNRASSGPMVVDLSIENSDGGPLPF